jgi:hypothetical protein
MRRISWVLGALLTGAAASTATAQTAKVDPCGLVTVQDVAAALGTAVQPGEPGGPLGTACQYAGKDDDYALIQVIDDTTYWMDPKMANGYEPIADLGLAAFSMPQRGGWRASGLTGASMAVVVLSARSATRAGAVALLRKVMARP